MESKKVLIFDFDGTIADSTLKIIEVLNKIAPDFGLKRVSDSEIDRLRGLSNKDLIREFKVPLYKIPFIYSKFRKEFKSVMPEVKPIPGISEVLKKLHNDNRVMYIVSSNTEENIRLFLKNNNMEYFDKVYGVNSIFGKFIKIKRILKDNNFSQENVVYIGDETRDIEAARKSGVRAISVTWGVNTKVALEKGNPDYLLTKPEELLDLN